MSAYLQMGHDSENLVGVPGLDGFAGLILSPVNRSESDLGDSVQDFRQKGQFDIALDSQLYCPQSERGQLPSHSYFPRDLDTADMASESWWRQVVVKLAAEAGRLQVDAVCSPAVLPRKYDSDYYARCSDTYSMLAAELQGTGIRPLLTVCVALKELAEANDALRIASILTAHGPEASYIVVEADVEPRREIADAANLLSVMVLVSALEKSGCKTLVSHCSSDMILLKAAGASHCASGKFFNLRRFSRSRFDEQQEGGGGQLPYWFEHNLLAFLREADIARLRRNGFEDFIGGGGSNNLFAGQIFEKFVNEPGKPWVGLSWRQYLAWFAATEKLLSDSDAVALTSRWLRDAEERWLAMDDKDVLLEETRNNGKWIRPWRQALGISGGLSPKREPSTAVQSSSNSSANSSPAPTKNGRRGTRRFPFRFGQGQGWRSQPSRGNHQLPSARALQHNLWVFGPEYSLMVRRHFPDSSFDIGPQMPLDATPRRRRRNTPTRSPAGLG